MAQITIVRSVPVVEHADLRAVGVLDARELRDDALGQHRDDVALRSAPPGARAGRAPSSGRCTSPAGRAARGGRCGVNETGNPSSCAISATCWCAPTLYGRRSRGPLPHASTPWASGPRRSSPTSHRRRRCPGRPRLRAARRRGARRSRSTRGWRSAGRRAGRAPAARTTTSRARRGRGCVKPYQASYWAGSVSRCAPERSITTPRDGGSSAAASSCDRHRNVTSASQASAAAFVMRRGTRSPPLRLSRGSSAVASLPASESDPTAYSSSSGWRRTRSSVS